MSPSRRLAFAWRLTDRAPGNVPHENDPNLENFIVRITDGTVLAKSHGSYWDLGSKIAVAFVFTALSLDSHLFIKVEQRAESASVELFAFAEDDTALGPFELVHVIKSAVIAEMKSNTAAADYGLVFSSHPAMTIDNQGLVCLWLQAVSQNGPDSPVYETIIQVHGVADSLSAKRQFNQAL